MSEDFDEIIQLDQAYVDRTYAERDEKVPVIFKQGEYVLIKAEMSAGDERVIKNSSVRTTGQGKNIEVRVQIGDIEFVTLQRMIRGWSITKTIMDPVSGGTKAVQLPYSTANVEKLPRKIYNFVKSEIERLNPDENAEQEVGEKTEHPLRLSVIDSSEDSPSAERVYHLR